MSVPPDTASGNGRTQRFSGALKVLVKDNQAGVLAQGEYRQARRRLLQALLDGEGPGIRGEAGAQDGAEGRAAADGARRWVAGGDGLRAVFGALQRRPLVPTALVALVLLGTCAVVFALV
jgi:hypothetical protein